ncbi:MAG: hypothetical protein N3A01_09020 [Bacteroidales bacterium]|nr:hypothetical protein [Bacteroidales bacterium]
MKRLFLIPVVLALIASLFTNCKKDEETGPAPTITFSPTSVQITQDTTIAFVVTISAEEKIKVFKITKKVYASSTTTTNIPIGNTDYEGKTSYTYAFSQPVAISEFSGGVTKIEFEFYVSDEKDQTATKTFTVTKASGQTGTPFGAHNTYTGKVLGGQSNASVGSFFSTSNGNVYTLSAATSNQALIDIIYYYGSTNLATFAAPSDPTVNGGSGNFDWCTNWTTKNNTKFIKVTNINFDNLSATTDISGVSFANATTKVNQLAVNDVIAFKTANNKIGFAKITDIQTGGAGTITFSVKVQQ